MQEKWGIKKEGEWGISKMVKEKHDKGWQKQKNKSLCMKEV